MKRILQVVIVGLGGLLLGVQLVPYGRDHDNPPVVQDAPWSTLEGRRLAVAACYDCHSNETKWPWYSHVAPRSWLVQRDVENGRRELNFSNWDGDNDSDDLVEAVGDGSMPPRNYRLLRPDARLSDAEKTALIGALQALADEGEDEDRSGSNRGPG
ncbi:MAG: heme-binding domain-containing protein [Acidimicrobiales bacterium]